MSRIHNFSAGPAVLPLEVLEEAQRALIDVNQSGLGILECSHRSALFDDIIGSAKTRLRRLLQLDEDQQILFLQGGARTQFFQIPMNFLRGGTAAYIDTGTWSAQAIREAQRFGHVEVLYSSKSSQYDHAPRQEQLAATPDGARYLHYTSNNTVAGSEFHYLPESPAPLVCDMSSDILSRPVEGRRFGLIYAGAQKNIGPAGVTLVIVRKSWLETAEPDLPLMLRYADQVAKDSLLNTPPTFGIYIIGLVTQWIESQGGLEVVAANNARQAAAVYALLDGQFYKPKVREGSRSLMNITFTTGDADLDTRFHKEAAAAGLAGLKGHSSVGGLRASIYNAQTDAAIDALVDFMKLFAQRNG